MQKTTAVGIRELKNKLSAYLREVRNGTRIMVLDRGEVIGIIRAPRARLSSKARRRVAEPAGSVMRVKRPLPASPLSAPTGTAAALLDAERGE